MSDKLPDCPFCEASAVRCGIDPNTIMCSSADCPASDESWTEAQWRNRPIEDRLNAALYRARGWASVVIRQCDALNIELPEFNNWGDDIDKLMRSQTVFPKEKGQKDE